ncbi:MAG: hypothetical protein WC807_20210 [Hyphomicrobium sp.]|jgi:hypothetical protein
MGRNRLSGSVEHSGIERDPQYLRGRLTLICTKALESVYSSLMSDETAEQAPSTAPESFSIQVRGWGEDEDTARRLGEIVGVCVRELSRQIDLSGLDGVTVAGDFTEALAELDRGYETNYVLTPSNDAAIGVAMTPSVLREGQLKNHIVLNAYLAAGLLESGSELFRLALHTIAHECAHVEITAAYERCFPNVLLRTRRNNLHQICRWDVILACWDEYAATRICAQYGEDPTEGYEQTFVTMLESARGNANDIIRAYRLHGDHGQVFTEVYAEYGRLMKYTSYHLGNLDGQDVSIADRAVSQAALAGHWFAPYLPRLHDALRDLYGRFGDWNSEELFDVIGDIADDIVREGGVLFSGAGDGVLIDVPYTADTMPCD